MTDHQKSNGPVNHEPFKATKIWNDIIEHLKTNVEQRRRRWKFQYFENCFRGGDMVEILHAYVQSNPYLSKDASRSQVTSLGQILLEKKVIECVASDVTKKDCFEDNSRLYRFSTESSATPWQITSDTGLSAKVERRASKRRSLLGIGDKSSTRRKSISFTPRAQNRLVELLSSSPSTLLSTFSSGQIGEESPKKRRRLSLDGGLRLRKDKLSALTGLAQDFNSDVWFEVALSKLLYLTEVPFLEDVLAAPVKEKNNDIEVVSDSTPCVSNEEKENRENSLLSDVWVAAGLDCIQLQSLYPLAQQGDMGYTNITNITKSEVHQWLLEYYGSLLDTLIPANLSNLVEGILCLLATDRTKKIVNALQLLIMLLPVNNRKHIRKLLNFLGNSSERFVVKKFVNSILPRNVTNKITGYKLVAFMTENQRQIFTVPAGLKAFITRCTCYEQKGLCHPLLSTACHQVSVAEYADQTRSLTEEALIELMTDVIEDLNMSPKDKEEQLKLFQKHHNEIFMKQFPSEGSVS